MSCLAVLVNDTMTEDLQDAGGEIRELFCTCVLLKFAGGGGGREEDVYAKDERLIPNKIFPLLLPLSEKVTSDEYFFLCTRY